ncbi:MAG: hypothetical protein ACRETN_04800 [Nevskiales bacterium]
MATTADSITQRLHAEIDLVPQNRREPLLKIVHAYREAVDDEIEGDDPRESLRQAIRDVKAGRTYPIKSLWDGIDAK